MDEARRDSLDAAGIACAARNGRAIGRGRGPGAVSPGGSNARWTVRSLPLLDALRRPPYAACMAPERVSRLDLAGLLAAVEDAPPVAAADVLGERLCDALGASEVTFLIADFSGGALIRLGHAGVASATRTQGRETAERVPLGDTPHGRALADQTVVVERGADHARVRTGHQPR
jgi:hypothetical protein